MIGAGSMSHAIASLKANKRERKHFPGKDLKNSIYTNPIVFKKSSKKMCTKTANHIQSLKIKENIRLGLVLFIICSLISILVIIL